MADALNLPLRIDDEGDLVDDAGFVPDLPEELEEIARRVNLHDDMRESLEWAEAFIASFGDDELSITAGMHVQKIRDVLAKAKVGA